MKNDRDKAKLFIFLTVISFIIASVLCLGKAYKDIQFNRKCSSYLKLAADANNIQLASERLDKAITYVEKHGYTSGTTAVIWDDPKYDLDKWYGNLKAAQKNLHSFPANASETEISTTLVKLRETLLDHGENGDIVTLPPDIAVFPNNTMWFILTIVIFTFYIMALIFCMPAFTFTLTGYFQ